jgi:glycosyltransferase involved in cell wall biosynthesis
MTTINPIVSIIVPVFNAQKYLNQCIQSVINQSFTNWELILVNDGSSDNSGDICNHYSAVDARIKVIHKRNEGVGAARNDGIDTSSGIYFCFLDADDWLDSNALNEAIMASEKNQADLIQFGCKRISDNGKILTVRTPPDIKIILDDENQGHAIQLFDADNSFAVWGKLIKKEVIEKSKLRFGNKKRGQDIEFTIELYKHLRTISSIPNPLYNYRVLYNISNKYDQNIVRNHIDNYLNFCDLFKAHLHEKRLQIYAYKLFILWFVVVVPINISLNKNLSLKEKKLELNKIFLNTQLSSIFNSLENKPKSLKYFTYDLVYTRKSPLLLFLFSFTLGKVRRIFKLTN